MHVCNHLVCQYHSLLFEFEIMIRTMRTPACTKNEASHMTINCENNTVVSTKFILNSPHELAMKMDYQLSSSGGHIAARVLCLDWGNHIEYAFNKSGEGEKVCIT